MRAVAVAGSLGAEILDADPRSLDADDVAQLLDWLHEFEVVFFPGADLAPQEHMALAARLGEVDISPMARFLGATEPSFQTITDGPDSPPVADEWHTDVTWVETPPKYALLQAEIMPERGGDTLWASMTTAYEALSPTMQGLLAGLEVEHDVESFLDGVRLKVRSDDVNDLIEGMRRTYPAVVHPLVRTHPVTARRALFLGGGFMRRIKGLHENESAALLDFLARHINDARFHCRWRWREGDLAIWDERSTNHRSAADHFPQVRSIRRIEVAGDRPYFEPAA